VRARKNRRLGGAESGGSCASGGFGRYRLLDDRAQAGGDRFYDWKIIFGKGVLPGSLEGEYGSDPRRSLKRNGEGRTERSVFGVVKITGFDRWIAVQNRLVILGNPARHSPRLPELVAGKKTSATSKSSLPVSMETHPTVVRLRRRLRKERKCHCCGLYLRKHHRRLWSFPLAGNSVISLPWRAAEPDHLQLADRPQPRRSVGLPELLPLPP
jgi:hypothetical protein